MDGMTLIGALVALNSPFYVLVVHNAVQTRVNKELLEKLNGINQDEQEEKEGENANS